MCAFFIKVWRSYWFRNTTGDNSFHSFDPRARKFFQKNTHMRTVKYLNFKENLNIFWLGEKIKMPIQWIYQSKYISLFTTNWKWVTVEQSYGFHLCILPPELWYGIYETGITPVRFFWMYGLYTAWSRVISVEFDWSLLW